MSAVRGVRAHNRAVGACISWLHQRAREMNDPHAQGVLNSAAFDLGQDKPPFPPASETVEGVTWAIINALDGYRAAEHAREFQTQIWRDATKAANAVLRLALPQQPSQPQQQEGGDR